jgi:hypothetical protein
LVFKDAFALDLFEEEEKIIGMIESRNFNEIPPSIACHRP